MRLRVAGRSDPTQLGVPEKKSPTRFFDRGWVLLGAKFSFRATMTTVFKVNAASGQSKAFLDD